MTLDQALVVKIVEAAHARFDPCGAAAFAERLGREIEAGRISFPAPLQVGGTAFGRLEPDRCTDLAATARTLARALAAIAAFRIRIEIRGQVDQDLLCSIVRKVENDLAQPVGAGAPPASQRAMIVRWISEAPS